MKKILTIVLIGASLLGKAQKKKDEIVYYEDSKVKNSRFGIAIMGNPNFTDRRLINNEIPLGGGYDLADNNATGHFEFNYNLDLIFTIGSPLDISVGIGKSYADYTVHNGIYYLNRDSITVDAHTQASMLTVPIRLNFNTSISDIFDLEVTPLVQMNFIDSYKTTYDPVNGEPSFAIDYSDETQKLTWSVGIALGGTYKFADNWGVIFRPNVMYSLNPLIEKHAYPRETLLSYGVEIGLKYSF